MADGELLDRLQRGAFSYLSEYCNSENGLVADTSRAGSPCSIAVVGFALSSYPIAVDRSWMSRADAAALTLKTLHFFWRSSQGDEPDATGFKGFYYHFLDMHSGRRVWQCELSLVDTTLLLAGILTVGCYFDGEGDEGEIRRLSDALYRRVDWQWAQNGLSTVSQGWKPECGFLHYGWEGYNEATIVYVLGISSPTHPLPAASFTDWTFTYQWENLLGTDVLYSGPLFTHLFSHAWIDYRGIRDEFMREKCSDYLQIPRAQSPCIENTVPAILEVMQATIGICGALRRATVRAIGKCGKTFGTGVALATCRAGRHMGRTTAPSLRGQCWLPFHSMPQRRCGERGAFSGFIRKFAPTTGFPAALIRQWRPMAMAGYPRDGMDWIRVYW